MKSKTLRVGVSIAISLLFLGFAVRGVDWWQALEAMRHANYLWILPTLPITVWTLYIRAQRWRVFLHAVGVPGMRHLVAATNIGFMANMVLPLRVGEVVRPVLVSRRERLALSGVLASVLLERIFDMFTILLLFGVSASIVPVSDDVRKWGWMLLGLATTVAAIIVLIRWQEETALGITRRIADLLPPKIGEGLYGFIGGFVKALEMLDSPGAFLRALVWSLFLWTVIASVYTFAFLSFHMDVPILVGSLVLTAVVAIAVSVPSAPGYVGAFQLGCVLGLGIFGISKDDAFGFSIVVHLTQFVSVIAAGLYSLWKENISLQEVESAETGDGAVA